MKVLVFFFVLVGMQGATASNKHRKSKARDARMSMAARDRMMNQGDPRQSYIRLASEVDDIISLYFYNSDATHPSASRQNDPAATAQVKQVLTDLNSLRAKVISVGGLDMILAYDFSQSDLHAAEIMILEHFTPNATSGIYEALTEGTLGFYLTEIRLSAVEILAENFDGWPAEAIMRYRKGREQFLADYWRLLRLVATEPRARGIFEKESHEKFESLFPESNTELLIPSRYGLCADIFALAATD